MSLSLLAVAALGLSACGGNDNQDAVKDAQKAGEALQKTAEQAKQQLDQAREQAEKAQQDATEQTDAAAEETDATNEDAQNAAKAAEAATNKAAQSLRGTMHEKLREIEQKVESGQISEAEGERQVAQFTREAMGKVIESTEASPEAQEQMKKLAEQMSGK